eukprot:gene15978-21684_t
MKLMNLLTLAVTLSFITECAKSLQQLNTATSIKVASPNHFCLLHSRDGAKSSIISSRFLHMSKKSNTDDEKQPKRKRKVVKYDNVGDPIYEGEENSSSSSNGLNILGFNLALDPLSLSLLIFSLIAFNFFVLANL